MYMDNINILAKNEKEVEIPSKIIAICKQDNRDQI